MADYTASQQDAAQADDTTVALFLAELAPGGFTPALFRLQFPAFASGVTYPDAQVGFYLGLASKMLIADRWGTMLDEGIALFAAHFLALDRLSMQSGPKGVPGQAIGVLSSASVDKVSYSRDVSSVMEVGAGHWNMTIYGLQFIRFSKMMGTGPLYVGAGYAGPGLSATAYAGVAGAWPGVMPSLW